MSTTAAYGEIDLTAATAALFLTVVQPLVTFNLQSDPFHHICTIAFHQQ
jgi:hypothetical protein